MSCPHASVWFRPLTASLELAASYLTRLAATFCCTPAAVPLPLTCKIQAGPFSTPVHCSAASVPAAGLLHDYGMAAR